MTMVLDPDVDDVPEVLGLQEPRLGHYTEGATSLGDECSIYAETFTLSLLPWQDTVIDWSMQLNSRGKWSNRDVCLIVSRQNGKGSILTARCLYGLYVLNEKIIHTAHEVKTASDAYSRIKSYIQARPLLAARTHFDNKYGIETIEVFETPEQARRHNDHDPVAELSFLARTAKSGRGLFCDLLILDEAYELTEQVMRALQPTQNTSENPQTWYTSSAVDQKYQFNGLKLAAVRKRGFEKKRRVMLAEWSADPDADRNAYETWAQANPSMCRLRGFTVQTMLDNLEGVSRDGFDVEYLSIGDWPEPEVGETLVDMDQWRKLAQRVPGSGPMCVAIEQHGKWWTVAAAQFTAERDAEDKAKVRLEVGFHAKNSTFVVDYVGRLVDAWDPVIVMSKNSPAMSLYPQLARAGIEPEELTAVDIAAAAGGLIDAVGHDKVVHSGDGRVDDAWMIVRKKELAGGAIGFDYKSPGVLSPLQGIALARFGLLRFAEEPKLSGDPAFEPDYASDYGDSFDPLSAGF